MSDINEQLQTLSTKTDTLKNNKVARFAFTEAAYTGDIANGVESYNYANDQNIPLATKTEFNDTILSKGLRSQSASVPRAFMNHFFGRVSYNLNKTVDYLKVILDSIISLNKLAGRYTATTKYSLNDVCSMVVSVAGTPQVMTFIRITSTPVELSGVPPLSGGVLDSNWAEAFSYKADSNNANFTGTPTAPTAAAGTNTTQLATTAFVIAEITNQRPYSNANPVMNGTAAQGSSTRVSRQDHVHPIDTSRAPLAGPAFTGVPTAPTAAAGTNTTQLATTAFVIAEITNQRPYSNANPVMNGTAAQGSSTRVSRQDHVHPIDTSRAPLASPAFTGTPTAPTATAGTNTTQIATTAFVTAGLALKANLASPALTGTPTAPTATAGTNSTQIATTAFVAAVKATLDTAIALKAGIASPVFTGNPAAPTAPDETDTTQIATTAFVQSRIRYGAISAFGQILSKGSIYNAVQRVLISEAAQVPANSTKHILTWICPYYGSARVNLRLSAASSTTTITIHCGGVQKLSQVVASETTLSVDITVTPGDVIVARAKYVAQSGSSNVSMRWFEVVSNTDVPLPTARAAMLGVQIYL